MNYPANTKLSLLSLRDTPAYRVTKNPYSCNVTELLAALIGGPRQIETAEALMAHFHGNIKQMYQASVEELAQVRGIGMATAVRIKAGPALGFRLSQFMDERPTISSPGDAAALIQAEMSMLQQECLYVMLLDTRNRLIDIIHLYQGSVNSSQVRVGEIFQAAVQRMASTIIVIHSHPSGDPTPSPDDQAVTRAIVQAGKLLDISVADHIVIGQGRWISLRERGLGFN